MSDHEIGWQYWLVIRDPGQPGILSRTKCASFKAALTAEGLFSKAERKLGGHRTARAEAMLEDGDRHFEGGL